MFSKVKLKDEQYVLIKQLSKEVKLSENEVASFFVEMGMAYIIACRKGLVGESLSVMTEEMQQNEALNRIAQRLEAFYNNG